MATVSLDGIAIEVPCLEEPQELARRLHDFAQALAEHRFPDWGLQVSRAEDGTLNVAGGRDGTIFAGEVQALEGRVCIALSGRVELAWIKVTLAGGHDAVRQRIADEIRKHLINHLS